MMEIPSQYLIPGLLLSMRSLDVVIRNFHYKSERVKCTTDDFCFSVHLQLAKYTFGGKGCIEKVCLGRVAACQNFHVA